MNSWDVIIAGGGLIGVSTALELRERGASVLVLERGQPGQEASSAAAGMLAATDPETPPALRDLALAAAQLYPAYVGKLQRVSGLEVDFRREGTLILGEDSPGPEYRCITEEQLQGLEPFLQARGYPAFLVAEDSVDPVLLMRAVVRAAELSGVEIRSGIAVRKMIWNGSQVEVTHVNGRFAGKAAVNCLGAWSGAPVKPRKGQMLYLKPSRSGLLQRVVRAPGAYIVPRSSGKILVGTTVEDVGYDKSVDAETIRKMHESSARYLPELHEATLIDTWAGLRPGSPDDLPLIGQSSEPNVFLASGMYRNGILLAPMVAKLAADLVGGKMPALDIAAFSPARFAEAGVGLK